MSWDCSSRRSTLPTPSDFTDISFHNSAFNSEELQQVGSNRYVIQRRNTKIILEGLSKIPSYSPDANLPAVYVAQSEKQHNRGMHLGALTWLLSGLYAMVVFDIGLVMKISQFIAVDITAVEFNWYFIVMYTIGAVWLCSYQPLITNCFKHKERLKSAKSGHTNNLWLIGLLALFGLAIIVKDGLAFIAFLTTQESSCAGRNLYATVPVCNAVFLVAQVNYLFRHSKVFTQKFQILTKFGLMHVIATNLTIWIGLVIDEAAAAVQHSADPHPEENSTSSSEAGHDNPHGRAAHGSHHTDMMFPEDCECDSNFCSTVALAQAFLFPFVIEFSLVASCLLYLAWRNVGKKPELSQYVIKPSYKLYKSYKGVASGCLVLFVTIMVIVLLGTATPPESEEHSDAQFIYTYNVFFVILETIMILTTTLGFYLFHKIHQDVKSHSEHLDVVLLIICLVGPLVYGMFSMFGIALSNLEAHDSLWALSFVSPLLDILQCLSQVIFLMIGLHRKPITSLEGQKTAENFGQRINGGEMLHEESPDWSRRRSDISSLPGVESFPATSETNLSMIGGSTMTRPLVSETPRHGSIIQTKTPVRVIAQERIAPPGKMRRHLRDVIMFLLASNFCLWVFLSLEGTAFDVKFYQDAYYGSQVWTVISMIARPLNIFFRMHSAACLFEMWSFA